MPKPLPVIRVRKHRLSIDLLAARVKWHGQEVKLTRPSYAILALFASDPYAVFTKEDVIKHSGIAPSAFHCRIKRLRQVFQQSIIVTHGMNGYSLLERK